MRVAVVGGGAIGSACALFVHRLDTGVDVHVIEPDPGLRLASSARSAASIRQQFSTEVNVRLSQFGLQLLRDPDAWLAVDDDKVDLGFVESGYLFVATRADGAQALRENHAVQRACGAPVSLLTADALSRRVPWLRVDDVQLASLGEGGEGWFDGYALARALARKSRALGAAGHASPVVGFERRGERLRAVQLADGTRIEADVFVLAAGAWSRAVGALAGFDVPVFARRRTVFAFTCPQALPRTPLVIDPSGVWFRSEGRGFIGGWSPRGGDADPDDLPLDQPDLAQFDERVWPALAHRVPAFAALRRTHAWDGYYEVHPADHNGLLGPHPQCANLLLACGFSGHGLQHAAGVGRGIAEWIVHGGWRSLDLSPLSPARIAAGRPLVERAVI
ncbi:MAG TPA: FAD-binding oxidoreductase [Burkholderiaceae bacterium]|nr:FAD-binding oxidoreductase [Burkholderiaceae bacterium]